MYAAELVTAVDAVRAAAGLCLRVQPGSGALKEDRSPVTVADFGSQAVICRILQERFPGVSVMAEEAIGELEERPELLKDVVTQVRKVFPGAHSASVLDWIGIGASRPSEGRYWVLDPVDGTKGFVAGRTYAVALALVIDGEVVLGALACPDRSDPGGGRLFAAEQGQGAALESIRGSAPRIPVQVSDTVDPRGAIICESFEAAHSARAVSENVSTRLGASGIVLRIDSQAKYGAVASGEADIYLRLPAKKGYVEWAWDHAAGMVIVQEAGGMVTDFGGNGLDFAHGGKLIKNRGVVATNGRLHAIVLEALHR